MKKILYLIILVGLNCLFIRQSGELNQQQESYQVITQEEIIKDNSVLGLINQERINRELQPFIRSEKLDKVAKCRADYLVDNDLWTHDGFQNCFTSNGVYNFYGENLAKNWATNKAQMNAWMNSETHKNNILGDYKYIGIAELNNVFVTVFSKRL